MVNGFEAPTEPPLFKPACQCTLGGLAVEVENVIDALADVRGIEWKGRIANKITNDIETLLDSYYTFLYCDECRPSTEVRT